MIKNYIKIALRNLLKYKTYSFINIVGLAIGIAACITILLFIQDDLGYDKYHEKADQIYRVHTQGKLAGNELNMAVSPAPLGEAFVRDFPEVIHYTRFLPNNNMLIRYKDNVFNETRFFWADSTTFEVFTMPFVKGNPKTALNQPHTVVLTETLAKKYFGDEDPMDKVMNFEDGTPYTVRGVIKDSPPNTHFHYDMFASVASIEAGRNPYFISSNFYTYIVLKKGASAEELQKKLPAFTDKYAGPQLHQAIGIPFDELEKRGDSYGFYLTPLTDIHLHSHLDYEIEPNSDIKYVYIFSIIAVFILLIACINFMNLSTARSAMRSKEVGIRKVLGSNKAQLVKQFLIESILLAAIAIILAIMLVEFLLPSFSSIAGKELHTNYFDNPAAIPAMLLTILVVGLLAGSYPAFFLSSFQPVKVMKGKNDGSKNSFLRSGLVVFQFAISIILFAGTFIVSDQLRYVQEKKLGFNKEHVLVIQRAWSLETSAQAFKDGLLKNPDIISVSNSNNLPGKLFSQTIFRTEDVAENQQFPLAVMSTDHDFTRTMGIELSTGRYFSTEYPSDTVSVVLNENAVKYLGIKDAVGKRIILVGANIEQSVAYNIIGVVKDFHYESLHQEIRPLAIFYTPGQTSYLPVRLRADNIASAVSFIQSEWKKFVPGKPFEYFFLDDDFNNLYQAEHKTGQIFTSFSVLAIFIACLGLFGLAAFTAERKTKEIGIRKVLGASVSSILLLISKEFLKWLILANLIAWPIAYYFMNGWLQDFAYRIDISLWVFFISGITAIIIALVTVMLQAMKAAIADPVRSLKYE
ncbi:MAG: ABC transporter permease [Ignavibacteriaceae bacterium]